jgi:5-formyltetrahydrofolate cyclo-ligase
LSVYKAQLRKQYRSLWQQWFSAPNSAVRLQKITDHLTEFLRTQSGTWGLYKPLDLKNSRELDITVLETRCSHLKWVYPKILEPQSGQSKMAYFSSAQGFSIHSWGICEPITDADSKAVVPDGVIVPGLAFDRKGIRLGQGKGFYDVFLAAAKNTKAVGVVPSSFLVTELPREAWDQIMSGIVTEEEVLWFQQLS